MYFVYSLGPSVSVVSLCSLKMLPSPLYALKKILEGLAEAIAETPLPIMHFSLDLWTCKVSGKKYIGVHIFWVGAKAVFKHALVAVSQSPS